MKLILSNTSRGAYLGVLRQLSAAPPSGEKIVIVPDRFTASVERGILRSLNLTASFGIRVMSFTRLAGMLIGDKIEKCLTPEGAVMLLARVIEENRDELTYYGRAASARGFAREFYAALTSLRNSGISAAALKERSEKMPRQARGKAADLALIYDRYSAALSGAHTDSSTRLEALAEYLGGCDALPYNFYVLDFYDFNAPELAVLSGLAEKAVSLTVGLTAGFDNPNRRIYCDKLAAKVVAVCGGSAETIEFSEKLHPAFDAVSRYLFSYEFPPERIEADGKILLRAAATRADEADSLAVDIVRKVQKGARYRDFEIMLCNPVEYLPLIKSAFLRYDIPFFYDAREKLADQTKARYLLSALSAAANGFARADVLETAKNPLFYNSLPEGADAVFLFENYVLKFNVDRTRFLQPFVLGDAAFRDRAESVRRELIGAIGPLNIGGRAPVAAFTAGARVFLAGCDPAWRAHVEKLRDISGYYVKVAEQVDEKLESVLCEIEDVLGGTADAGFFLGVVESMLETLKIALVPTYLDSVFVGDADSRYPGSGDVYVVGADVGSLPAGKAGGAVLTPKDEEIFAAFGLEVSPGRKQRVYTELMAIAEIMKKPRGNLTVSYAENGPGGATRPSTVFYELAGMLACDGAPLGIERIDPESFVRMKDEARAQELAAVFSTEKAAYHRVLARASGENAIPERSQAYRAAYALLGSPLKRRLDTLNREPEKLRKKPPVLRRASASRLECFFKCPFMHYYAYTLGLKKRDEGEFEGTENGTILHFVLEGFYARLRDGGRLSADEISSLATALFDRKASEPHFKVLMSKPETNRMLMRLRAECARVCADLYEIYLRSEFAPVYLEEPLGGGRIRPLEVPIPGGRAEIRGFIDRVDVLGDRFFIVDYKTYRSAGLALSEIYSGEKLQLYVYAAAVSESLGLKPAGVFYLPIYSGFSEEANRYKFRGNVLCDEAVAAGIDSLYASAPEDSVVPYKRDRRSLRMSPDVHFTDEDFEAAAGYVRRLAAVGVVKIGQGVIKPSPLVGACKLCDYADICAHTDSPARKYGRVTTAALRTGCAPGGDE